MLREAKPISLMRVYMATRRQKRSRKPLTVLASGQYPVSVRASTNTYDVDRKSDCTSYNACLTFAFQSRWQSFSCGSCRAYEKAPPIVIAGGNQWEGA